MKTAIVQTGTEVEELLARISDSANRTRERLSRLLAEEADGLRVLANLKFLPGGCDPLVHDRPLNLIEQVNQTFTYQASLRAAAWLLDKHPEHAPLRLNLGTSAGPDIASEDGQLLAEVFAAVDPRNNRKLFKDLERLRLSSARFRYVFYLSPTNGGKPDHFEVDEIFVRRLWEDAGR